MSLRTFSSGGGVQSTAHLTKCCTQCHAELPLTAYYVDRQKRDGRSVRCRTCLMANMKDYRAANRELARMRDRSRPEDQKARKRERERERYQREGDRIRKRARAWAKANPSKVRESIARRRRRISVQGSFTQREWCAALVLSWHRCLSCGAVDDLTIDHVVPVSLRGPNTIANLQPLCGACNRRKHTKSTDYRPAGWAAALARLLDQAIGEAQDQLFPDVDGWGETCDEGACFT